MTTPPVVVIPTIPEVVPTTPPPTAPPTTAPPLRFSIDVNISVHAILFGYLFDGAPRIQWTSTAAARVKVSGPGFASSALNGDDAVCPNAWIGFELICPSQPGTYLYVAEGFDASGQLLGRDTASLLILQPPG